MYHLPQQQSLTLTEHPHIHFPPLAAYWQHAKHKGHATQAGLTVTYWRTSNDGKGRLYAQGPAAQRLPNQLRLLLYERTHVEIDIIGAFYEIIRRTSNTLRITTDGLRWPALPPIEMARQQLQQELLQQRHHNNAAPVAKRLLHIAINAPVTAVAKYLTGLQYRYTSDIASLAIGSAVQLKLFAAI